MCLETTYTTTFTTANIATDYVRSVTLICFTNIFNPRFTFSILSHCQRSTIKLCMMTRMTTIMCHCKITYSVIFMITINMMNCVIICLKHIPINFDFFRAKETLPRSRSVKRKEL